MIERFLFPLKHKTQALIPGGTIFLRPAPSSTVVQRGPNGTDLVVYRGDTMVFDIVILDDLGNPQNLTGSVLTFALKYSDSDADADAIYSTSSDGGDILIINWRLGAAVLMLSHLSLSSVQRTVRVVAGLKLQDPAGQVSTISKQFWMIQLGVP